MDHNYRDNCREGYFGGEREPHESRQHPQQHLPQYTHQLPYHPTLLPPLQQPGFVLEQSEQQLRGREEYGSGQNAPAMLRSIYSGSAPALPNPNVLLHSGSHPPQNYPSNEQQQAQQQPQQQQQQLARLQPTTRPNFMPSCTTHLTNSTQAQEADHGAVLAMTCDVAAPASEGISNEPLELSTRRQPHNSVRIKAILDAPKEKTCLPPVAVQQSKPINLVPQAKLPSLLPFLKKFKEGAQRESGSTLPECLTFKFKANERDNIVGVQAKARIEEGATFGPYDGNLMDEEIGSTKESTWELCTGGKVFFYVDGKKKDQLNWMSYVRCAREEAERNVEAVQYYGQIYFTATTAIEAESELRVFYSPEYADSVGFKTRLQDLTYDKEKDVFQCSTCQSPFPTAKRMLRHIKFDHGPDNPYDMHPVISWKIPGKSDIGQPERILRSSQEGARFGAESPGVPCTGQASEHFICTVCGKTFPTEGRLEAHAMFHEFSEEHTCLMCGERQRNSRALAKHMSRHDTRPHKCSRCDKTYKTQNSLYRHNRDAHGVPLSREHSCSICAIVFVKKSECLKHEKTHNECQDAQVVKVTNEVWKKKKYQRGNILKLEEDARNNIVKKKRNENDLPDKAGENFVVKRKKVIKTKADPEGPKDMLGKTLNYYSKPRPYKCRYCPKKYKSRVTAYEHEKESHEGKGTFKCNLCPRVFMKESNFLIHYQSHEQNRLYRCSHCPQTFASDTALRNHQGEHTGLKPYKCEICGKGFRLRKWVCAHKRRMHKVREMRYFCSICNKGFTDKGPLQKHERRHKGIRPFVCLVCGKGFGVKYVLEVHMMSVHSQEKRYSCEICGKKFALNQHYVNHVFKHRAQGEDIPTQTVATQEQSEADV